MVHPTIGGEQLRFLSENEVEVLEVNHPDCSMRRFRRKSDPTDAESAVRSVLAGNVRAIPKLQSGTAEAMRVASVARRRELLSKVVFDQMNQAAA